MLCLRCRALPSMQTATSSIRTPLTRYACRARERPSGLQFEQTTHKNHIDTEPPNSHHKPKNQASPPDNSPPSSPRQPVSNKRRPSPSPVCRPHLQHRFRRSHHCSLSRHRHRHRHKRPVHSLQLLRSACAVLRSDLRDGSRSAAMASCRGIRPGRDG